MDYLTQRMGSHIRKLLLFMIVAVTSFFGQAGNGDSRDFKLRGPMGVFQLPRRPVKAPKAIRTFLPYDAKVTLLQKLTLNPEDTLVVYEAHDAAHPHLLMDISYPAALVLRQNHLVGQFSLKPGKSDDPDWVFLEAGEIHLSGEKAGVALAFRSMGDGSASLFLVISPEEEKYRTVLKRVTGEARLRADQEANLELWAAHFDDECEWCRHQYTIFAYKWDGSHLSRIRKTNSCRKLDPDRMTDKPIELVKKSLNVEYAEAQQERKDHRNTCDPRNPTRKIAARN